MNEVPTGDSSQPFSEDWIQQTCREVSESAKLSPDCPTIEHQVLKDMYKIRSRRKIHLEKISPNRIVNVFAQYGRFAFQVLELEERGALVIDERSNMSLLRGTLFHDPAQPPHDKVGQAVVSKLFMASNLPGNVQLSKHHSIPVLAAKGQVVEGGFLVVSPAYTEDQIQDALDKGVVGPKTRVENANLTILDRTQTVYWHEEITVIPREITKIQ